MLNHFDGLSNGALSRSQKAAVRSNRDDAFLPNGLETTMFQEQIFAYASEQRL